MTVSRAFVLAFAALALAVLGAQAALLLRWDHAVASEQRRQTHQLLGQTLAGAVRGMSDHATEAEAQHALDDADHLKEMISLRWVWLDATKVTPAHAPEAEPGTISRDQFSAFVMEVDREQAFVSYTPTPLASSLGAIEITERLVGEEGNRRTLGWLLLANTVIVLVLFAITGWVLGARLVGRPVRALAEMAHRVGAGDVSSRVALHTRTEFDPLAQAMNSMAASLEQQTRERDTAIQQVRHAGRLATVGQLAAGVAHELGTPLNIVQGRARMLQRGELDPAEAERSATEIISESERMTGLVRQLLDFAGKRGGVPVKLDLHDVVEYALSLLSSTGARRGVTIQSQLEHAPVTAVAGQLQQVVTNLVLNAIQASPAGSVIEVALRAAGTMVELSVRDHGAGLSPEVREHLFEPFFTTRPAGEGTGLGLAVTYGIVQELGGTISAANAEGGGARFQVVLPPAKDGAS